MLSTSDWIRPFFVQSLARAHIRTSRWDTHEAKLNGERVRQRQTYATVFWQDLLWSSCTWHHKHTCTRASVQTVAKRERLKFTNRVGNVCVIVCAENNRNPAACALAVALNIGCKLFWFFSLHTPSLVVNSHLQLHILMSMHEHTCIRDYSFCLHTHSHTHDTAAVAVADVVCLLVLVSLLGLYFFIPLSSYT